MPLQQAINIVIVELSGSRENFCQEEYVKTCKNPGEVSAIDKHSRLCAL